MYSHYRNIENGQKAFQWELYDGFILPGYLCSFSHTRELVKLQYVTELLLSQVSWFLDVSLSRKLPQIFCLYCFLVFISEEENVSVPLNDFTLCNLYKKLKPTLIVSWGSCNPPEETQALYIHKGPPIVVTLFCG